MNNSLKDNNVKLEELELLDWNPRFSDLYFEKDSKLKNLWFEIYEKGNKKSQIQIAAALLEYEDNFSDFIILLNSLAKDGFNENLDRIIVIETKNQKKLIAEGNRRLLALKILLIPNFFSALQIDFFKKKSSDNRVDNFDDQIEYEDGNLVSYTEKVEKDWDSKNKNFKKLAKCVEENKKLLEAEENKDKLSMGMELEVILFKQGRGGFDFNREADCENITKVVIGRSTSAPGGKRKWPRYQTLTNTWNVYSYYFANNIKREDNKNKSINETANLLFRDPGYIENELKYAKFIHILKWYYEKYDDKDNMINMELDDDWNKLQTSAIELSINNINLEPIPEVNENNFKKLMQIEWDINSLELKFSNFKYRGEKNDEFISKFSHFLIDTYLGGWYTSRGWKEEKGFEPIYLLLNIPFNEDGKKISTLLNSDDVQIKTDAQEVIKNSLLMKESANKILKSVSYLKTSMPKKTKDLTVILLDSIISISKNEVFPLVRNIKKFSYENIPFFVLGSFSRSLSEISFLYLVAHYKELRKHVFYSLKDFSDSSKTYLQEQGSEIFRENSDFENKIYNDLASSDLPKQKSVRLFFKELGGGTFYWSMYKQTIDILSGSGNLEEAENFKKIYAFLFKDNKKLSEFKGKETLNTIIHSPFIFNLPSNHKEIALIFQLTSELIEAIYNLLHLNPEKINELEEKKYD